MPLFYFDDQNALRRALAEIDAKYSEFPAVGVACFSLIENFDEFEADLSGYYLAIMCRLTDYRHAPGGFNMRKLYTGARQFYLDRVFATFREIKKQDLTDEQRTAVNVVLLELVNYIYETTGDDGAPYFTIE